ncbi:MAG: TIGR03435 family protein [Acidobacteriota bacterium]
MTLSRPILFILLAASAFAQPALQFELATIKPAAPNAVGNRVVPTGPGRISFQNMTLRLLIYYAYGNGLSTALSVSGGPDWMNKDRYTIEGQAQGSPTQLQFRFMLRALLEERFALKTHYETRPIDVYALLPARSDGKLGPKVQDWDGTCAGRKPASDEDDPKTPRCTALFRSPGMFLEGVTMFAVAEMLSLPQPALGRIVEDRTGLTGRYKLELEFEFAPARPGQVAPDSPRPSIFTAVREQWGLKLEPAKGSLQVLVVESVQPPTEN